MPVSLLSVSSLPILELSISLLPVLILSISVIVGMIYCRYHYRRYRHCCYGCCQCRFRWNRYCRFRSVLSVPVLSTASSSVSFIVGYRCCQYRYGTVSSTTSVPLSPLSVPSVLVSDGIAFVGIVIVSIGDRIRYYRVLNKVFGKMGT